MKKLLPYDVRYSYEEFADHIKAMKLVRHWEYTSRFGHIGTEQTSQAHVSRVVEYFSDCFEDQHEAVQKAEVFLLIYDYIARHATYFAKKDLIDGAAGSMLSVDPALLRAVHYIFTETSQPSEMEPKRVLILAKAYQQVEAPV